MEIVSVNTGAPREIEWRGDVVRTSIFKEPVVGPVAVRRLNLDGDEQSDLSVHGGPNKAVYAYQAEHYEFWRNELPEAELGWGSFGENLTIVGLPREDGISIGDRLRAGSALFAVTQPRLPCFKLSTRFGRADMVKRFLASGRTGFYFSVVEEGVVAAGDEVEFVSRDPGRVSVADVTRLYAHDRRDLETMRRAAALEALPGDWRRWFAERVAAGAGSSTSDEAEPPQFG
ncbi:MAG: MOSC domain-containing protein [Actinomycetota bacterium]